MVDGDVPQGTSPAKPGPVARRPWLTDRAALKLALWAIALVVGWQGVLMALGGAGMTYETAPATYSEPTCEWHAEMGEGGGQLCMTQRLEAAEVAVTPQGRALMALGSLFIAAAVSLLVYQGLRWNPSIVGEWFAPAPRRTALNGPDNQEDALPESTRGEL